MPGLTIRTTYSAWTTVNGRLRDRVATLTEPELALRAAPDRWPVWATIGHLACQRVFWLCDFAGEPGADTTPFTDAAFNCPGDDDLEHVLDAGALVEALDSTFRIVERALDTWTVERLTEVLSRPAFGPDWVHTRGAVIQRVFTHDVYHCADVNQALATAGLREVDLWA
jgi:uncharacterized damage-inducible protein DinB